MALDSKTVYVCRTPTGDFLPFDVGDHCPVPGCGALIDHLEAPVVPVSQVMRGLRDWRPETIGIPAAACARGHLLETAEGRRRWLHLVDGNEEVA